MLAARWYGPRDVRVEEIAEAPVGAGEVRLRIRWCGICGSDLHEYTKGPVLIPSRPHPLTRKTAPVVLGHEFTAEVTEVGAGVSRFGVGDRVTANACLVCHACAWCRAGRYNLCEKLGSIGLSADGAFAESVVVPEYTLYRLPEGLSWETGALTEPVAVALHAVKQARLAPGETAAVVGAGTIGLLVLQAARACGAQRVYAIEPAARRRRIAHELGAAAALDPGATAVDKEIHALTAGLRAEVVFECVGSPAAVDTAIRVAGKGGRVVLVGVYTEPAPAPWGRFQGHEKQLVGSSAYTDEFPLALAMLEDGRIRAEPLLGDRIPLREIETRGFRSLIEHPDRNVKIIVSPV